MEKINNKEGIKLDLESLFNYRNEIDGWDYYLKKYVSKIGSLPKISSTEISLNDLQYLKQNKKEKNHVVKIFLKALESDDFIKFVIDELGHDLVQTIVWSLEPIERIYIESIYNIEMLERRGYYQSFKKKYAIFNDTDYYIPNIIEFPTFINQRFQSFFETPKDYYPNPITKSASDQKNHVVFNGEKQIFDLASKLFFLSKNNFIKTSTTGKILKPSITKVKKENIFNEIFPAELNKATDNFLLNLLLTLLSDVDAELDTNDVIGIIKNILNNIKVDDFSVYRVLMELYGGNPNGKHIGADYDGFFEAMKFLVEPDKWYSPDSLMRHLQYKRQELDPIDIYVGTSLKLKTENNIHFVEINHYDKQFTVLSPYLNGIIYTLASLGLVETSSDFKTIYASFESYYQEVAVQIPFAALKYFRLTKLGRYIFELDDNYETPKTNFKETEVLPDTNSLTLSLSEKNDLIHSHLSNFAKPMGAKLFLVSEKSFLKKVATKDQMEKNIVRLKQLSTKPLPPNWIDFLKQLEQRFNPLIRVKDKFLLYKIPDNNPELLNIMMADSKLKSLYTKVDNKQLLVKKKSLPEFRQRMTALGWVMEDY